MTQNAWIPEDGYGDRLRRIRTHLGLDVRAMADAVMHSRSTYGRHERSNELLPGAERLAALIEYKFNVPVEWTMYGHLPESNGHDDAAGTHRYLVPTEAIGADGPIHPRWQREHARSRKSKRNVKIAS